MGANPQRKFHTSTELIFPGFANDFGPYTSLDNTDQQLMRLMMLNDQQITILYLKNQIKNELQYINDHRFDFSEQETDYS